MAVTACKLRTLEHRLQTLQPLELSRHLDETPSASYRATRPGEPTARHHLDSGSPLCSRSKRGHSEQALGRSCGGFTSKIHAGVDGLGNPLAFVLTGGNRNDSTQARQWVSTQPADNIIADKSDDANWLVELIEQQGATAVIPSRRNRRQPRAYDQHLYQERHLIECFFNKIKHYRRVFSRFDKLARNYMSFLGLVAALIWLR